MEDSSSRVKRGLIRKALGTVKEVANIRGSIKDFVFNLADPIFKSLRADHNECAIMDMTRCFGGFW